MRVPHLALLFLPAGCVGASFAFGCSGSSRSSAVPTDASATDAPVEASPRGGDSSADGPSVDAAAEVGVDSSRDARLDSPGEECVSDAHLATVELDAALPDGASVTTCLECAGTRCASYITACDTDCECKVKTLGFLACAIGGQSLMSCAAGPLGEGNAFALGECTISLCQVPCGGGGEVAAGSTRATDHAHRMRPGAVLRTVRRGVALARSLLGASAMNPPSLRHMSWALVALLSSACVSTGKYDAAVKSGNEARADLASMRSNDAATLAELRRKLEAATTDGARLHAADDKLRADLAQLGFTAETLSAEKDVLASALGQARARLDELARAQTAAESRARLYKELALRLKKMVDAGDLRIALRDGRMVLQLPNDVLFASGQVDIRPRGQAALRQVASVLRTIDGRHFQIAGHTDNVPIDTSRYPSNWELSTARGVEVVRYLVAQGVAPTLLAAGGYGEFDPVAPNDNDKDRARNRRIEITLQPNVDEMVAVPMP